jgi:hypothetical protein
MLLEHCASSGCGIWANPKLAEGTWAPFYKSNIRNAHWSVNGISMWSAFNSEMKLLGVSKRRADSRPMESQQILLVKRFCTFENSALRFATTKSRAFTLTASIEGCEIGQCESGPALDSVFNVVSADGRKSFQIVHPSVRKLIGASQPAGPIESASSPISAVIHRESVFPSTIP